jgi:hypothetical protein
MRRPVHLVGLGGPGECVIESSLTNRADLDHVVIVESTVSFTSLSIKLVIEAADIAAEADFRDRGAVALMVSGGWCFVQDSILSSAMWAGLGVSSGTVIIRESVLRESPHGVYIAGGSLSVRSCSFEDVGTGVWSASRQDLSVEITGTRFVRAGVGIGTNHSVSGHVEGNTFVDVGQSMLNVRPDSDRE